MAKKLMDYVELLKHPPEPPSFEPEIDDLDAEQDRKIRCARINGTLKLAQHHIMLPNVCK